MGNESVTRPRAGDEPARSEEMADLFWALGDPFRLSIVEFLRAAPRTVTEITDHVEAPQPNVSRHLKALRERGLVETTRDGKWVHYSLRAGALDRLARWVERHERAVSGGRGPKRDVSHSLAPAEEERILFFD